MLAEGEVEHSREAAPVIEKVKVAEPVKAEIRESIDAAAAAEALRIPLSTLNQKIKRLNIDVRKRSGA